MFGWVKYAFFKLNLCACILQYTFMIWFVLVAGDFGSLQMPYLDGKTPTPSEDARLHWAWVAMPILMMVLTIATLLLVNQRKQWMHVPCYHAPSKVGI